MSVIIKGLNKFYSCRLCPFNNSDCYCNITKGRIDRDDYSCEAECPIVQLPKCHGRLIDADYLRNVILLHNFHGNNKYIVPYSDRRGYRLRQREVDEGIINAPTIIEADGGDAG